MDNSELPKRLYREIFEAMADAAILFELDSEGRPGCVLDANQRAEAIFGSLCDRRVRFEQLATLESRLAIEAALKRLELTPRQSVAATFEPASGDPFEVQLSLSLCRLDGRRVVVAVFHDMGSFHKSRRVLQRRADLFRTLAEFSPFSIVLYHKHISYANPAFCSLSGYTLQQLEKMAFADLVHPSDRERVAAIARRRLDGEQFVTHYETCLMGADGLEHTVQVHGVTVREGGLSAGLVTLWDVTEQRRLEGNLIQERQARLRHEQLLMQQSRFAAMGQMIAAVAHQWKQPLSALSLLAQSLNEEADDRAAVMEYSDQMLEQIAFMNQTLSEFSAFFRQRGEPESFDLRQVALSVFALLAAQLRADQLTYEALIWEGSEAVTLEDALKKGDDRFVVTGYPGELKQVLLNLVINAREAVLDRRKRGAIDSRPPIALWLQAGERRIWLRVRDRGGGVDDALRNRIFEPYFTTKGEKGTGIGLYIAHEIVVRRFGGTIWYEPIEEGSEFIIDIPLDKKV